MDGDGPLVAVLERARDLGFLGPGDVAAHIANAEAFVAARPDASGLVVDLGTGGGVPALVLVAAWPAATFLFVESMAKRSAFLREAVHALGLADRVEIGHERAEILGRAPRWRGQADVVTARSFAGPATTAECAAPFLREGGVALISEPPDAPDDRWPADALALLALRDEGVVAHRGAHVRRLRCVGAVPDRYPRRSGVPAKRPLW